MLTPQFYNSASNSVFREEVSRFVYYAQAEPFHHPLSDASNSTRAFSAPTWGAFGVGKGPGGTAEHHPAVDMRVGSGETNVNLYACLDGRVSTFRDADKYRHYLSISSQVVASNGDVVGTVLVVYGHIDLDLDEADALFMDGQYVTKGALVSKHLYSGTVGGPHLHFEIRYYRLGDAIGEEFYGGVRNPDYSEPSSGPWSYGAWAPNVGYGFGYPGNHGIALE
jgi:murein DD-endopeptidase MepM/ murein hydrolase activator NlpD